ncbi:hypothetical protein LXL04_009112 [Taraxacum kok-saghyz]
MAESISIDFKCAVQKIDFKETRERRNITVDGGEALAASTGLREWRRLEEGGGPRCCSSEEGWRPVDVPIEEEENGRKKLRRVVRAQTRGKHATDGHMIVNHHATDGHMIVNHQ